MTSESTVHPDTGAPYDHDAQVHLGVFYTGVGPQFVWTDPNGHNHSTVEAYVSTARLLERGLFDAFFLGEGLRVRENRGRVYDLDVSGRPDAITQLAVLAGATEHIGLVATQNATYNYPADLARRLASLDLISDGRTGWNIVTTDNAWTGANFRRPGWLEHERRYERADQFVSVAKQLWSSWQRDAVADTGDEKSWARPAAIDRVEHRTDLVDVRATATVPGSRQGRPVLFQAGDSDGGRDLAAKHADVVFSANVDFDKAVAYARDLRSRLARYGRSPESVRILPGAAVVLGATPAEAEDKARWIREQQMSPPRAIAFFEQYWGTDLSAYDPHGPLPDIEPVDGELDPSRGTIAISDRSGKLDRIAEWRALAEAENLSILDLARRVGRGRPPFVGTPNQIADTWARFVRTRAVDGFNLSPQLSADLDDVVEHLVPELQERGVYRSEYTGSTLREHLNLPDFQRVTESA